MRILFIAPRLPVPADTGAKIRTLNIIKQIAQLGHTMDLVSFSFEDDDKNHISELKKYAKEVICVPMEDVSLAKKIFHVLFNKLPFSIYKYYDKGMEETLKKLKEKKYDIIHFDHLHTTHYRYLFEDTPCVVDEHNVEFKILQRCARVETNPIKKTLYEFQAKKMMIYESQIIKEFDGCLAVSKNDKEILEEIAHSKVQIDVIPNGVDTAFFKSEENSEQKDNPMSLVFTGSMDWLPNEDAVIYFCKKIFPLILKKKKDVTFYIVGKNPSAQVRGLKKLSEKIVVTGCVDDVRPYVEKSNIFVVPIRVGGGTRLKILEAMAMRKIVVSTSIGAEGIKYTKDQDIIIADEPEEFANAIFSVMERPEDQLRLIKESARELVCQTYDWKVVGQHLQNHYEKITK